MKREKRVGQVQSRPRPRRGLFSTPFSSLPRKRATSRGAGRRKGGNDIKKVTASPIDLFFYLKMRHSTNVLVHVSPTNSSQYTRVRVYCMRVLCVCCVYRMRVWLIFSRSLTPSRAVLSVSLPSLSLSFSRAKKRTQAHTV